MASGVDATLTTAAIGLGGTIIVGPVGRHQLDADHPLRTGPVAGCI
jgi:hypothetical protein